MIKFLLKNFKKILLYSFLTMFFIVISLIIYIAYDIHKTGFSTEKTDIKYYDFAIHRCHDSERCAHFPREIPKNANDIKFYFYSSGLGGQTIYLDFKTNKNYIHKEIENTKYSKLSSEDVSFIFSHARGNRQYVDINSFTSFYETKRNRFDNNKNNDYFTGFGGIAVDKDLTRILYYHINPEG